MFKNRSFLVKVVKDEETPIEENQPIDIDNLARVVTKSVVTCTVAYVGADIIRRVVIYAVSSKY
jgi:hypothetical protein